MISDIFWAGAYILTFIGSMSFGYLTIRYSIPNIRAVPKNLRLGLAGIVGVVFFIISTVLSVFLGRPILFFSMPAMVLITCSIFEVKHRFFASDTVQVALPVISTPREEELSVALQPMVCPKCRTEYHEEDVFCGSCGKKLR